MSAPAATVPAITRKITPAMEQAKWRRGISGNPSGRPKIPEEIKRAYKLHSAEAVEILVDVMRVGLGQHGTGRTKAACEILDRAWGKPVTIDESDAQAERGLKFSAELLEAWFAKSKHGEEARELFVEMLLKHGVALEGADDPGEES